MDFLKGNIYQIKNCMVEKFESRRYDEITDLIEDLKRAELIIEVNENAWIPREGLDRQAGDTNSDLFEVSIEDGVNLARVRSLLAGIKIRQLVYYGKLAQKRVFSGVKISEKEMNFSRCLELSNINGEFCRISEAYYFLNRRYNSCWGKKIAIMKEGSIRPCIYTSISVGDIGKIHSLEEVFSKLKPYWELTKDGVKVCRDCELRYVCFDCREIARMRSGDLFATNPHCRYDPHKGEWRQ